MSHCGYQSACVAVPEARKPPWNFTIMGRGVLGAVDLGISVKTAMGWSCTVLYVVERVLNCANLGESICCLFVLRGSCVRGLLYLVVLRGSCRNENCLLSSLVAC